jgi:hypothetical protein
MEFIPNHAPAVVLSFLGTCLVLGLAGLVVLYAWATKRTRRAWQALGVTVVVGSFYVTLLVGAALTSDERILAPGEWKYFCEVDCHLAYTVTDVQTTKTLGSSENPITAQGLFYVVTIKTWFDKRTTASWRPRDLALRSDPRLVVVVDGYGNSYPPFETRGTPLAQPLLPGQSYTTDFVFDLPADRPNFRLLITTDVSVNWFLIGHESSLFHKKVFFALEPTSPD